MVVVSICSDIVDQYMKQGYRMSLRQLYYQCISRDVLPASWIDREYNLKNNLQPDTKNTEKNYKRLGGVVGDGRLAGLIDWDGIEDRGREPSKHPEFNDIDHLVEVALSSYRLDRWQDQRNYVEIWVEKDALSGVLEPLCREYHVTLMVNKGYSSLSAMKESADRFKAMATRAGKRPYLLYVGDHDPSGEDMVRDVGERLYMFGADVKVEKLALTWDQIEEYDPPPNPTKLTDSRAKAYVDKFGMESWEVDALDPDVLDDVVRKRIAQLVDSMKMGMVVSRENIDREFLRSAMAEARARQEDERAHDAVAAKPVKKRAKRKKS